MAGDGHVKTCGGPVVSGVIIPGRSLGSEEEAHQQDDIPPHQLPAVLLLLPTQPLHSCGKAERSSLVEVSGGRLDERHGVGIGSSRENIDVSINK